MSALRRLVAQRSVRIYTQLLIPCICRNLGALTYAQNIQTDVNVVDRCKSNFGDTARLYSQSAEEKCDSKWTDLSYNDMVALIESKNIQLIDVREPKELTETGHIPGAVNVPLGQLKEALNLTDTQFTERYKVAKPQKHDTNIVFCGLGPIKSNAALEIAHKVGYKKVRHYVGGYEDWCEKQGKPLN